MTQQRIGLRELCARAKPEECPFCGEPRKKRVPGRLYIDDGRRSGSAAAGRPSPLAPEGYYLTCGDRECAVVAYHRYWRVDENARIRSQKSHLSVLQVRKVA